MLAQRYSVYAWKRARRIGEKLEPYRHSGEQHVHLSHACQLMDTLLNDCSPDTTLPRFNADRRQLLRRVQCCIDNELMITQMPTPERATLNDVRNAAVRASSRTEFVKHRSVQTIQAAIRLRAKGR